MIHHRLIYIALLILTFSGRPAPQQPMIHAAVIVKNDPVPPRVEDEEFIPWLEARRLSWDDFLCAPVRNSDAVASTSTSLGISYQVENGELTYKVTCNFSKNKSWGLLKTDYILAHEQGHFDITELFARRLHKAMQEYAFNKRNYRKDVNDIYRQVVKEKEDMQAAYDGETDHSRKRRIQYEWLEKIDGMLKESAPYALYP